MGGDTMSGKLFRRAHVRSWMPVDADSTLFGTPTSDAHAEAVPAQMQQQSQCTSCCECQWQSLAAVLLHSHFDHLNDKRMRQRSYMS